MLEMLQELRSEVKALGILGCWAKTAWPAVALTTAAALVRVCGACAAASGVAVDAAALRCWRTVGCLLWLAALHRTSCPSLPSCLGHRSRLKMGSQSTTGSEGGQSCHFANPERPIPGLPCLHAREGCLPICGVKASQEYLSRRAITAAQHQREKKVISQGGRESRRCKQQDWNVNMKQHMQVLCCLASFERPI